MVVKAQPKLRPIDLAIRAGFEGLTYWELTNNQGWVSSALVELLGCTRQNLWKQTRRVTAKLTEGGGHLAELVIPTGRITHSSMLAFVASVGARPWVERINSTTHPLSLHQIPRDLEDYEETRIFWGIRNISRQYLQGGNPTTLRQASEKILGKIREQARIRRDQGGPEEFICVLAALGLAQSANFDLLDSRRLLNEHRGLPQAHQSMSLKVFESRACRLRALGKCSIALRTAPCEVTAQTYLNALVEAPTTIAEVVDLHAAAQIHQQDWQRTALHRALEQSLQGAFLSCVRTHRVDPGELLSGILLDDDLKPWHTMFRKAGSSLERP